MNRAWPHLLSLLIVVGPAVATAQEPTPAADETTATERAEFFERHVRPVFVERCVGCHGPKKQEAGLRLDSRRALLQGGDDGPVVDLTNPAASRLLKAIGYQDEDLQMPPPSEGKLSETAIAALNRWIVQGAQWPNDTEATATPHGAGKTHWAFQPIRSPKVPSVRQADWPLSAIDDFILAAQEAAGVTPGEPADRATLNRRASFDLIGLPPSVEETAAFEADAAPDAFAKVVNRLLESPHYGERWGRHWLDVARYADTKGYVRLQEERRFPYAFTYREYVIRSFNEDLPYDRFIVEQLAADEVAPSAEHGSLAALGFLTLGRRFTGNKHDIIDDRIDVVTRGLLGLTVTCARCHDHKYDPIPTADYYALYSVFASGEDPIVPPLIAPLGSDAATQAFQRELEVRLQALEEYESKQYAALLDDFRDSTADYLVKALEGRVLLQQPLPTAHGEVRPVVVDRWIDAIERTDDHDPIFGAWHQLMSISVDHFAAAAPGVVAAWAASNDPPMNSLVRDWFVRNPPRTRVDVARGYGQLLSGAHRGWQTLLASATAAASALPRRMNDSDSEALRAVLYSADSPVAVSRQLAVGEYLYDAPINDEIVKRRNAVGAWLADTARAPPRAHTVIECPVTPEARILVRGNPTRPGRRVPRQFLTALSGQRPRPLEGRSGRLELAKAIVDRDNPLTARVIVNRVWMHHFGEGLVRTPSNFGLRGQGPTHPDLLDYLATQFVNDGWSLKKLHRQIMLSRTYQQSSRDRAECQARDPENRLLWRMNRRRLDFEAFRDTLLTVAGRIDLTMGGPSAELTAAGMHRRTVYGLIDRQALSTVFPTFDFASPDAHSPQRYTTTVPQQALFLLNGPWTLEMSRSLVARDDVQAIADPQARIGKMVELAWGRRPTAREAQLAWEFLERDKAVAQAGEALDSWQALAQTLLLSNELMYVD